MPYLKLYADTQRLNRRVEQLESRAETLSRWRVVSFVASSATGLAIQWAQLPSPFHLVTLTGFGLFAFLVFRQDRLFQTQELFKKRLGLARKTQALSANEWESIPSLPLIPESRLPSYFSDLDLVTGHSLLRLINHTVSTLGFSRLLGVFCSNDANLELVHCRQRTTREMVKLRVLRRRFLVVESLWAGLIESDRVLKLLEKPLHTSRARFFFYLVAGVQTALVGLFILFSATGGHPYFLVAGLALLLSYRAAAREINLLEAYSYGMSLDASLGKLAALSEVATRIFRQGGPELRKLLKSFSARENPQAVLARTGRVVGFLGVRQNYILHMAVNLFLPWDVYWTLRLEKLRREIRSRLPVWLSALADLEVAISLAEFTTAHPEFVFAEVSEAFPFLLRAREVGHPLISNKARVGNDIELNADAHCLILTGSNMSGKSTFLRSLGVNLLLAKAGTVVCARSFEIRCLQLATSLRLSDSLEDGLSSFYAEVRQLKAILDQAEGGTALLYLIDEVFRGTNNRERLLGSQAFVRRLANTKACGLITTHDLELSQLASQAPSIRCFHFKEDIEGDRMSFSYKMASGPCPTTNALRVMKLAGLPID